MTGVEIDAEARVAPRRRRDDLGRRRRRRPSSTASPRSHGSSPDVGVVGYTLGGGIGWLARKHGLAVIERALGRGRDRRRRGRPRRPGDEPDLFWALRGGGGSFGVVTELEIALYPVTRGLRRLARSGRWSAPPRCSARWAEWTTRRARGGHLGRPAAPDPADPGDARDAPRPPVRRRRGRVPRRRGARAASCSRPLRELEPEIDTFAIVPAARAHASSTRTRPARCRDAARAGCSTAFDAAAAEAIVARRGDGRDCAAALGRGQAPRGCARAARPERRRAVALRGAVRHVLGRDRAEPGDGAGDRRADRGRSAAPPGRGSHAARTSTSPSATTDSSTLYPGGSLRAARRDSGGGRSGRRVPREARDRLTPGREVGELPLPPPSYSPSSSSASRR